MKIKALAIATLSLAVAGSAQAALIAGWDFSQYTPGVLSTDGGSTLVNTLSSNYSDLDDTLTPGIGFGSTQWGTMHVDGTLGSFSTPLDFLDPLLPQPGNINQNLNQAIVFGDQMGGPGAGNALLNEDSPNPGSQQSFNDIQLVGTNPTSTGGLLDVVFEANLGASFLGDAFALAFAGATTSGTSDVVVEFSTNNGTTYNPVGTANLTTTAAAFNFALGGSGLSQAFVRLRIIGSATILPAIDNVTILGNVTPVVPEPGTAMLALAGILGLGAAGRRRLA